MIRINCSSYNKKFCSLEDQYLKPSSPEEEINYFCIRIIYEIKNNLSINIKSYYNDNNKNEKITNRDIFYYFVDNKDRILKSVDKDTERISLKYKLNENERKNVQIIGYSTFSYIVHGYCSDDTTYKFDLSTGDIYETKYEKGD